VAEHPNADLFRRGYKAFSDGDMDTMRTLFADDVVWHHPGNNQLSGTYKGTDAIIGLFGKEFEISCGTIKVDLHDVLATDDHVVGLHTGTSTINGENFTSNEALVAHVRDGKATEFWLLPTDMAVFDRAWG
jgi:ketosteroid isomerase-like protein